MPGRPEQGLGSRRQADVRVAGGIVALVALTLHDHPANPVEEQRAADQVGGNVVHGAIEEIGFEPRRGEQLRAHRRISARDALAASSCSASRADAVPPAEPFDSSDCSKPNAS